MIFGEPNKRQKVLAQGVGITKMLNKCKIEGWNDDNTVLFVKQRKQNRNIDDWYHNRETDVWWICEKVTKE